MGNAWKLISKCIGFWAAGIPCVWIWSNLVSAQPDPWNDGGYWALVYSWKSLSYSFIAVHAAFYGLQLYVLWRLFIFAFRMIKKIHRRFFTLNHG